ncbi:siderophore-interacting protein [Streptomyces hydrogenans]|uniref:siderophore-interacting protein n=1 Tax=Streptomyces hydrogenans TaxID=1873719 RepID=UPI00167DED7B|nr:SIP domain-containing protein [Streptomyces hydrogenans]
MRLGQLPRPGGQRPEPDQKVLAFVGRPSAEHRSLRRHDNPRISPSRLQRAGPQGPPRHEQVLPHSARRRRRPHLKRSRPPPPERLEAEGAEPRIDLPAPAGVEVTWHDRVGEPGAALVHALRRAGLGDDTHVWITCEASAVRKARSYLLDDRMLPRPQVTTRGYWRVGEADHPHHDHGED